MKGFVLVLAAALLVICSCFSGVQSIEREDIFSLDVGPMEDQIAMYNLSGEIAGRRAGFDMRDGLFYIVDGNGGKIVRYNSYGDMLFMIYNEETNPAPAHLKTDIEDGAQVTRWAFSYPLREPGEIAVDSRKHIFVEDRLPRERYGFDSENNTLLDRIILHFDSDGRFIDYLGQEGIGGTPFPRIAGIFTSIRDELVVVCRVPAGWNIFWFDSGNLLYVVRLESANIPTPEDWPQLSVSVDSVMAAPDERRLYIKADYYRNTFDELTNTRSGTEPYGSVVWILNVEDGKFADSMELPFYEISVSENGRQENIRMLYSMLGVMKNGRVLLYYPDDEGYALMFTSANSQERRRASIKIDSSALQYNVFNLSDDGLLSAMLVDDFHVTMAWWRTDRFIGVAQ
ncbi:MAG TPA: hypothetical protein DEQ14_07255 [Treponema sp.]|nr:hypothetical protein [Treponema sp.]